MHYVFVSSTLQFWCKVMPSIKLTETFLKSTDRPSTGTVRYWDSEIKGFVAHVQKTTTTFYYDRDNRRHLIGKFPTVRLERAREAARDLDYRLRRGYARHVTQSNPMIREMMEQYVARPTLRSDVYRKAVARRSRSISNGRRSGSSISPRKCAGTCIGSSESGVPLPLTASCSRSILSGTIFAAWIAICRSLLPLG